MYRAIEYMYAKQMPISGAVHSFLGPGADVPRAPKSHNFKKKKTLALQKIKESSLSLALSLTHALSHTHKISFLNWKRLFKQKKKNKTNDTNRKSWQLLKFYEIIFTRKNNKLFTN